MEKTIEAYRLEQERLQEMQQMRQDVDDWSNIVHTEMTDDRFTKYLTKKDEVTENTEPSMKKVHKPLPIAMSKHKFQPTHEMPT